MMSSKYSRVCAEIDMDAIAENFRIMHEAIHPETKMVAVIKTDGYGHGAVPIAQMIQPEDYIWGFAVATMTEAMILRKNQITKPVLILGYTFEEDYEDLIRYEIRPIVFKLDMAKELSEAAVHLKKTLSIHIGLDTGMSRIGFSDTEESIETGRGRHYDSIKTRIKQCRSDGACRYELKSGACRHQYLRHLSIR